jgi:hypothetical protein
MSSLGLSLIVFVFIFGGAIVGMILRRALPDHHVRDDSRDVIKLATGLVGTMSALVLGLLVASAKGFYDAQTTEITQISANIVFLDRALGHFMDLRQKRRVRRCATLPRESSISRGRRTVPEPPDWNQLPLVAVSSYEKIEALNPSDDLRRSIKSQALSMAVNIGQMRMLMYEQGTLSISKPLLVIMVFWLTVPFVIWGLLAPPNGTVIAAMLASALAVSGAILLILEMYSPYEGFIRVSDAHCVPR